MERRVIKEILNKRNKRQLEEEDEKEEEMEQKKRKSPQRRTSRDLVTKMKMTGGGHKQKKKILERSKTDIKREKDSREESPIQEGLQPEVCRKGAPARSSSGTHTTGGFLHGPGYFYTDTQGQTFDQYGRRVFRDDKEQTMEELSEGVREEEERNEVKKGIVMMYHWQNG